VARKFSKHNSADINSIGSAHVMIEDVEAMHDAAGHLAIMAKMCEHNKKFQLPLSQKG